MKNSLIASITLVSLLASGMCVFAQDGKKSRKDLSPFEGTWVLKKTSRKVFASETWHIKAADQQLRITMIRSLGDESSTNHVLLFVDKRGEENQLFTLKGTARTEKSTTSWEDGAIVRRYLRLPKQTTEEKLYSSDHLRLSKDGKKLTVLSLDCPEFFLPTNPSQEKVMCFDFTRTFEKEP